MKQNAFFRGEVWVVQLDPAIGSELKKTRPTLIISNNGHNYSMAHITVLPITDVARKMLSVEVFLPQGTAGLFKDSKIRCHHVRSLDRSRFVKLLGILPPQYWPSVEKALHIHLGLSS